MPIVLQKIYSITTHRHWLVPIFHLVNVDLYQILLAFTEILSTHFSDQILDGILPISGKSIQRNYRLCKMNNFYILKRNYLFACIIWSSQNHTPLRNLSLLFHVYGKKKNSSHQDLAKLAIPSISHYHLQMSLESSIHDTLSCSRSRMWWYGIIGC